jgi:hypothetical protein
MLLAMGPVRAHGQEGRVYAGASAFISTQDSHRQGTAPSLPRTGVGGTTVGGGAEFGGFVTEHVGLGVEFALPARITAVQETDYTRIFQVENRYRELTMFAVARAATRSAARIRLAAVGGAGLVQESSLQRRRDALGLFPLTPSVTFGPYSDQMTRTRWTYGVTFGGEAAIALSRHAALVPAMRVNWVHRSDDTNEPMWVLGLSSIVYRPSVGVRAYF